MSSSREVLRRSACAIATAPSQPSWLEHRSSSLSPAGQLCAWLGLGLGLGLGVGIGLGLGLGLGLGGRAARVAEEGGEAGGAARADGIAR